MLESIIYRSNSKKKSIISQQGDFSYSELLQHIQQYALLFEAKGYTKVAIYSENRVEWFFAFYAALQNNCIAVPFDFMASPEDVAYMLDDCQPELVFISEGMKESFAKVELKSSHHPETIVFENHPPVHDQPDTSWIGPEDNETTAVIIYTSGTTGSPKGVMLSYTNLLANIQAVIDAKIFHDESQVLILLPLHHIFPLLGSMMVTFYSGGTTVVSPSMQSSDLMKTLADNSVTVFIGVPRLYELIYRGLMTKINKSLLARTFLKLVYATGSRKLGKTLFKKVHQGLGGHLKFMVAGGAALNYNLYL